MSLHLISKLKAIRDQLLTVSQNVYHYEKPERSELSEYIVWQEDGEGDPNELDNAKREQVVQFSVNLYTKTEYSPTIDALQNLLADSQISFTLVSVTFETETKYIHYEWQCEI